MNAFIRTERKFKLIHLSFHLRKPEREEQSKAKVNRRKDVIKIRAD